MTRDEKRSKNFTSIINLIRAGKSPSQISTELGITKQRLNYYIATLKRAGSIKKLGYGVWDFVMDFHEKEVKKSNVIGNIERGGYLKPDMVRGHGFLVNFRIKALRNWDKREQILDKLNIKWEPYTIGGIKRGQIISFRNKKIRLTDRSIVINFPESYISDTAQNVRSDLIYDLLNLINGLENLLHADFKINKNYVFKVSRQHYALIKNALAKQYDKEHKKLEVYSYKGLWLLIDNSFNLHELETLHKDTADKDNLIVQNFFNDLKENPVTPSLLMKITYENSKAISKVTENQLIFDKNMSSHLEVLKDLGTAVKELRDEIKKKDI